MTVPSLTEDETPSEAIVVTTREGKAILSALHRFQQEMRERIVELRREVHELRQSAPLVAGDAAQDKIDDLRREIAAKDLAVARVENDTLKAEIESQERKREEAKSLAEAESRRAHNEWIRGVALVVITSVVAVLAAHFGWH